MNTLNLKPVLLIAILFSPALMHGMQQQETKRAHQDRQWTAAELAEFKRQQEAKGNGDAKAMVAGAVGQDTIDQKFVELLTRLNKLPEDLQQKIYGFDKTITPLISADYAHELTSADVYQDATGWKAIFGSRRSQRIGLQIFDLTKGKFLQPIKNNHHPASVTDSYLQIMEKIAVYHDATGPKVVSGWNHRALFIWDLASGKLIRTIANPYQDNSEITHMALHQTAGEWNAVTTADTGRITIWNLTTEQCRVTDVGHTPEDAFDHNLIRGLAVYQDESGPKALTCSSDKSVKLWDLTTGKHKTIFEDRHQPIHAIAAYYDHGWKVIFTYHTYIMLWDLEKNTLIRRADTKEYVIESIAPFEESSCWVAALGSVDKKIWYLNLATGELAQSPAGHSEHIHGLKAYKVAAGWKFVTWGFDKKIRTWRYASETAVIKAEEARLHLGCTIIKDLKNKVGGKTLELLLKMIYEYAAPEEVATAGDAKAVAAAQHVKQ